MDSRVFIGFHVSMSLLDVRPRVHVIDVNPDSAIPVRPGYVAENFLLKPNQMTQHVANLVSA